MTVNEPIKGINRQLTKDLPKDRYEEMKCLTWLKLLNDGYVPSNFRTGKKGTSFFVEEVETQSELRAGYKKLESYIKRVNKREGMKLRLSYE